MTRIYTTEIASDALTSDNPIHQRLFKAYVVATDYVNGDLLEIGCGEGRGTETVLPLTKTYTAVDKIKPVINKLQNAHPTGKFMAMKIPPLSDLCDNTYDSVISFQVIEHIRQDLIYLKEIYRVLKPGGTALITTPNQKMSLSRNPWHIREYLPGELTDLAKNFFANVEIKGITGNGKVMEYYAQNKKSVQRIMRFDIFNLQHKLPAFLLRLPFELLNRWNRNKLLKGDDLLVKNIHHSDYHIVDDPTDSIDLLLILKK